MNMRLWIGIVGFMATLSQVHAATPPAMGDVAPPFALATLEGKTVQLSTLTETSAVVLLVLRGFPGYQCPLCTKQVHDFVARAKDFAAKGVRVVMVYPGPAEALQAHAAEFIADKAWPRDFVFLVDPDFTFTNAYGLRWDAKNETAYPSTFVIDGGGVVKFAKISRTHGGRATAAEILAKLD
jgi:thioredoxin-dependent peroxiredoxin